MARYQHSATSWRRGRFSGWVLAATFAVITAQGIAQRDEGPILRPKKPQTKPTAAVLLVTCDLACNWKLDGEAKGSIEAGGPAKADVVLGQHLVSAATLDGLDKMEIEVEIKAPLQTIVRLALTPARDARLKAEKEASDRAAQEERAQAAREQQERDRRTREQAAREGLERERQVRERAAQAEASGLVWTDPATSLMWARKDSGTDLNWQEAIGFCQNLQLAGYSGWRLPEIDELGGIYDKGLKVHGYHIKGNLEVFVYEWSSSEKTGSNAAWAFRFYDGRKSDNFKRSKDKSRALCVRNSGQ